MPTVQPLLKEILAKDGIESKIYEYEDSDFVHDIYLVLNGSDHIFNHLDDLLNSTQVDYVVNYRLSFIEGYINEKIENSDAAPVPLPNAFTWFGTPAELAYLMDSLHEKGYIDAPKRTNGDRNNEGFSKMICSHFRLAEGSEKSVLNNLKDPRITPDNQFKIAMDKLPNRR